MAEEIINTDKVDSLLNEAINFVSKKNKELADKAIKDSHISEENKVKINKAITTASVKVMNTVADMGNKNKQAATWIARNVSTADLDKNIADSLAIPDSFLDGLKSYQQFMGKVKSILDSIKDVLNEFISNEDKRMNDTPSLRSLSQWKSSDFYQSLLSPKSFITNYTVISNGSEKKEGDIYQSKNGTTKDDLAKKIDGMENISKNLAEQSNIANRKRNNPFIQSMLDCGPDLYSNMFDICLRFTNSDNFETSYNMLYFVPFTEYDKKNPVSKISNVFLDAIKNSYALSVRTASIKIPTLINDTFEKPFLNTKITSPSSKKTINMENSITLDVDANNYFLDIFQELSGFHRTGNVLSDSSATDTIDNKYRIMSPIMGRNKNKIDIIVSAHSLSGWQPKEVDTLVNTDTAQSKILFVFEDVKFMGSSSALGFGVSKTSTATIDIGFIFKRFHTFFKGKLTNTTANEISYGATYNSNMVGKNKLEDTIFNEDTLWQTK